MPKKGTVIEQAGKIDDLSFEAALQELQQIVSRLEGEKLSLDESLALFERGQALGRHCDQLLENAELKIAQLAPEAEELCFDPSFYDDTDE